MLGIRTIIVCMISFKVTKGRGNSKLTSSKCAPSARSHPWSQFNLYKWTNTALSLLPVPTPWRKLRKSRVKPIWPINRRVTEYWTRTHRWHTWNNLLHSRQLTCSHSSSKPQVIASEGKMPAYVNLKATKTQASRTTKRGECRFYKPWKVSKK